MGFRNNSYATIWGVEPRGTWTKVRLNTSRKNKDTGEYEQDFSGFVSFVGNANAKAQQLKERDRIRLGDVDVTTRYDKEKNREYVNYTCFSFEMADAPNNNRSNVNTNNVDSNPEEGDTDDDTLPF